MQNVSVEQQIFPDNANSIIPFHSVAKEMNLSFSCCKSSGVGEHTVVSPYVEFSYMALNPWKFSNISSQGKAESVLRLQTLFDEYTTSFPQPAECIARLSDLLYTTLDMFTRRERIIITKHLIKTGLLSNLWGGYCFEVEQSEELQFQVYFAGIEQNTLSQEAQTQAIQTLFESLLQNDAFLLVTTLKKLALANTTSMDSLSKALQIFFTDSSAQNDIINACAEDIPQTLYNALIFLDTQTKSHHLNTIRAMLAVLETLFALTKTAIKTETYSSTLDIPIPVAHALGEIYLLPAEYALDTTILRLVNLFATLEKNILEEKSISWILSALNLFIHAGAFDNSFETLKKHFIELLNALPKETLQEFLNRASKEDFDRWIACFQFASTHTKNKTFHRFFTTFYALLQAAALLTQKPYIIQHHYPSLLSIESSYLDMLSIFGIPVEYAHAIQCIHDLITTILYNQNTPQTLYFFLEYITKFGDLYYKLLEEKSIPVDNEAEQRTLCLQMLHKVAVFYEITDIQSIQAFLNSEEYKTFAQSHPLLHGNIPGSTWFGSYLLLDILKNLQKKETKNLKTLSIATNTISVVQRSVQNLPSTIEQEEFKTLATRCTTGTEGINLIRKKLQDMSVSQDLYISTYLQVAVFNKILSPIEAQEIYHNLHKTDGVETPLFKVNLSNSLQLKGHLHEIRMASNATMFGFDVFAMNKIYREDFDNVQYEVDILMGKYGKYIGVEVKDLNDTRGANYKDIFDAVQKMGAFKRYQGDANTLAVLTQSGKPPSNEKSEALNQLANQCNVHIIYGGIREQLLKIDELAQPKK